MIRSIYVDDNIVTYIKDIIFHKDHNANYLLLLEKASLVYLSSIAGIKLEFIFSEDSLDIIKVLHLESKRRMELLAVWYAFQKGRAVKRNKGDLNRVKLFLKERNIFDVEDAQHIANAILPENRIDVFLTNDDKLASLNEEIKKTFGVVIMKPSKLAEYYKFIS